MSELEPNFWGCPHCHIPIPESELLRAPNPFTGEADEINGCPACFSLGPFTELCDENDCMREATCGTPSPVGYRRTCYKHKPLDPDREPVPSHDVQCNVRKCEGGLACHRRYD